MTTKNGNGTDRAARRQAILAHSGTLEERLATLPGPDGPVDVLVRELTGKQSRLFEQAVSSGAEAPLGFLLTMALVDPDSHESLFEAADREAVEGLGIQSLKPIIEMIQEMSGITDADVAKAKASLVRAPSIG